MTETWDEYLSIVNVAHEFPPPVALQAVQELLAAATSDDDIALVAAVALEPVVDLHYRVLRPQLEVALRTDPRFRKAWGGVITTQMPSEVRATLDALAEGR